MPFAEAWQVPVFVTFSFIAPLALQYATGFPSRKLTWLSVGQCYDIRDPRSVYQYAAALAIWSIVIARLLRQARALSPRPATRFEVVAYHVINGGCLACVFASMFIAADVLYVPYALVAGGVVLYYAFHAPSMPSGVSLLRYRSLLTLCCLMGVSALSNVTDSSASLVYHMMRSLHDETAVAATVGITVVLASTGASARVRRIYFFGMGVGALVILRDVPVHGGTRLGHVVLGPVGVMYIMQWITYTCCLTALSLAQQQQSRATAGTLPTGRGAKSNGVNEAV